MPISDDLRAVEGFLSAMELYPPDSVLWAQAVAQAWDMRRQAAPCGSKDIFCDCERCAVLPEKPAWMRSPQALVAMAERVVAAEREDGDAWRMHAAAYTYIASKSWLQAANMFGDKGDKKADCEENARVCTESLRRGDH